MVRIKHRYLLFNILYPTPTSTPPFPTSSSSSSSSGPPPPPPAYLVFSRPSPPHLTSQLLLSSLRASIQSLFGDHGLSATQSALRIVYFSPTTSTAIVRVPRAHFRLVWASLTLLGSLPAQRGKAGPGEREVKSPVKCVVRVVRVSGTIRKSEEEVLRRARREIVRAKRIFHGDGDGEGDVLERLVGATVQSIDRGKEKGKPESIDGMEDWDPEDDMDDLSELSD